MKPAQIVVDVVDAGGAIWVEAGHLKAKHVPPHLIPFIREHKAALLALLNPNRPKPDRVDIPEYDDPAVMAENLLTTMRAIGVNVSIAPDGRLSLTPENFLWDYDKTLITELEPQLIALLDRESSTIKASAESMGYTTAPAPTSYRVNLAPQRVSCGSCARFQPGPQPLAIGRCLATVDGSPPQGQRGYLAAYPMAPRTCTSYENRRQRCCDRTTQPHFQEKCSLE